MAILPAGMTAAVLPLKPAMLIAQMEAGADPLRWGDVLRHDVIPVAAAFVVFVALLVAYGRATRSATRTGGSVRERHRQAAATPGWGHLLRYILGMVAGGYVFFLAIVVVFYFVLGGEDESLIRQALVEGSVLAFVLVVPAFLLLSWIAEWTRSRDRGRRSGPATRR
jgi:type IV secretory pathway VirB2 component (pilin)